MDGANKLRFAISEANARERLKMVTAMIADFEKRLAINVAKKIAGYFMLLI